MAQDTIIMPQRGSANRALAPNRLYILMDNNGTGNYLGPSSASLYLSAPAGYEIVFVGDYWIDPDFDFLKIYDDQVLISSSIIGSYSGRGSLNVSCVSGYASLAFHANGMSYDIHDLGFELQVMCCPINSPTASVYNISVTNITDHSAM